MLLLLMGISQIEQIEMRRNMVLDLLAQGLNTRQIYDKLNGKYSVTIIRNDIKYHRKTSAKFVEDTSKNMAYYYKTIFTDLLQLKQKAWQHYNAAEAAGNDNVRLDLYRIIEGLNHSIATMAANADMIGKFEMQDIKEKVEEVTNDLGAMIAAAEREHNHNNNNTYHGNNSTANKASS